VTTPRVGVRHGPLNLDVPLEGCGLGLGLEFGLWLRPDASVRVISRSDASDAVFGCTARFNLEMLRRRLISGLFLPRQIGGTFSAPTPRLSSCISCIGLEPRE